MDDDKADVGKVSVTLSRDELMAAIIRFHDRVRHPDRCTSPDLLASDIGLVKSCLAVMKRELGGLADVFTISLLWPEARILALDLKRWAPRTAARLNRVLVTHPAVQTVHDRSE
jgi:hypothetical protein